MIGRMRSNGDTVAQDAIARHMRAAAKKPGCLLRVAGL
jgi:hypothetical protein